MKKRILALFMAFLFIVSSINVFPASASELAEEETDVPVVDIPAEGDISTPEVDPSLTVEFEYTVNEDKTCTVTGYKGGKDATALFIPSEIDGYMVTAIGEGAFAGFKNLTRVELPDTLYSIGNRAFERCYNFRSLFVPPNVSEIAGDAFWECYNLQFYTYPVCGAYYALQNAGYGYNIVEFEHEHECNWTETQNATCVNIGLEFYRCSMCPYFYVDAIPTVDHSFATREVKASCEEGAYTETYCTACGDSSKIYSSDPLGHTYGDWVVVQEGYCEDSGAEAKECTVCKWTGPLNVYGNDLPSCTGEDYKDNMEVVYDTFTYPGAFGLSISFDNSDLEAPGDRLEVYKGSETTEENLVTTLSGEFWGMYIEGDSFTLKFITDGSGTSKGFEVDHVEVYHEDFIRETPALGHDFEETFFEATCEAAAHIKKVCQREYCGIEEIIYTGEPLGHTYGDWVTVHENPCVEWGYEAKSCTVCGEAGPLVVKKEFPSCILQGEAINRDVVYDTVSFPGAEKIVINFHELSSLHDGEDFLYVYEGEYEEGEEPLLALTGYFTKAEINAESFTLRFVTVSDNPYYGFKIESLDVYDDAFIKDIAPKGHTFGDFEKVSDATCTEEGIYARVCSVCGNEGSFPYRSDDLPSCVGYTNSMYKIFDTFTYEGAVKLVIHFTDESETEENWDKLYVYEGAEVSDDALVSELSGKLSEVTVNGDSFTFLFESDMSVQRYGFEIDYIEVFHSDYVEITPPLGHSFGELETVKEASCYESGLKVKICETCGLNGKYDVTDDLPSCTGEEYYDNMYKVVGTYSYPGAEKVILHFSENTYLEEGYDLLNVYRGDKVKDDSYIGQLTGAFSEMEIEGDTFTLLMNTDGSQQTYGFEVELIEVFYEGCYEIIYSSHNYVEDRVISVADCDTAGIVSLKCTDCGHEGITTVSGESMPKVEANSPVYDSNMMFDTVHFEGAEKLVITFTEDSFLRENCTYLYIHENEMFNPDNLIASLTGDLSKESIVINGDSFFMRMYVGEEYFETGFEVSVEVYYADGYVETPAFGHKPGTFVGSANVTCTTDGYTEYICSVCGENYYDEVIFAPGHAFAEWIVVSEATCDTEGYAYSTCEVCGLTGKETDTSENLPSVTGESYQNNMSEYSEVYKYEGADRLVITFSENSELEARDYLEICWADENGNRYLVTNLYGDVGGMSVTINRDSFCIGMFTNGSATAYGYEVEKVEAYFAEGMQITPSLGHYLGEEYTVVEPTCTKEGYSLYHCTVCSEPIRTYYTASFGHSFTEWQTVVAPTCTEEGIEAAFCERCLNYAYRVIGEDSLPSFDGEFEVNSEVTFDTVIAKEADLIRVTFSENASLSNDSYIDVYYYDDYGNRYHLFTINNIIGTRSYDVYADNFEMVLYTGSEAESINIELEKVEALINGAYSYVSATGHTADENATVVAPTCLAMGYTEYTCTTCGETYKDNFIERLPHVFGEMTESYVGLCHEQSYVYAVCELCGSKGYSKDTSENLPSCRGEDYTDDMYKKYDVYSVPGATHYRVTFAENSYLEENWDYVWVYVANEIGEDYSIGGYTGNLSGISVEFYANAFYLVVETDTSYQAEGFDVASIEAFVDGAYAESESVSHDFEEIYRYDGNCVNEGYVDYQCTRCGYSERVTTPVPGHDYETTVYELTCTQNGYTEYRCTVCGETNIADYVEAPGHAFGEFTEVRSVTCYEDGLSFGYCERCGIAGYEKVESEDLPSCTGDEYTDNMEKQFETYEFEGASFIRITFSEDSCLEENWDYLYFYATDDDGIVYRKELLTGEFGGRTVTLYADNFYIVMVTDVSNTKYGFEVVSIEAFVDGGYEEVYSEGHDMEVVSSVLPTCTSYGEETAVCRTCGYENFYYTPMLDHEYEETYTAPTCTTAGSRDYVCTLCGDSYSHYIAPLGHSIEALDQIFAPTCTEAGYSYGTCTTCGTSGYIRDEGDNLPSFYPEQYDGTKYTETVYDPYVTESDFLTLSFSEDSVLHGNSYLVVYGVYADGNTEHVGTYSGDFGGEICTVYAKGFRMYLYTYAGDEAPDFSVERVESFIYDGYDIISATGHTPGEKLLTVEPTCSSDGYSEYSCSDCGAVITEDYVPSLGHSFGELEVVKEATCTENGYNAATCEVCGVVGYTVDESDTLPSCIGNDYQNNMNKTFDTYTAEGAAMLKIYFGTGILESNYDKLYVYGVNEYGEEFQYRILTGSFSGTVVEFPYESFYLRMTTDGSVTRSGFVVEKVEAYYEGSYEETEALGHEVEENSRTDATCDTDGVIEYKCIRCDYIEYGYIPALGHEWEVSVVEPTCSVDGYTLRHCTICGTDERTSETPKTGHVFGEMTEEFAATCTENGYKYAVCEVCSFEGYVSDTSADLPSCTGNEYQDNMNKTFDTYTVEGADHLVITFSENSKLEAGCDYVKVYGVDPVKGSYLVKSLTSNIGGTQVYVEAPSFYLVMTTDHSRTYHGFEVVKVEAFGNGGFEETSALSHELYEVSKTEPDCYNQGVTEYGCTRCDYVEFAYVSALTHEYEATVFDPTCVADGYTEYICALCGSTYRADYVQANGHSDVHVETVDPTCVEAGYDRYECEVCGEGYMLPISPTGHKMGEWHIEKEPLLLEEGLRSRTCLTCDFTETEVMDKIVPDLESGDYGLAHFTVVNATTLEPISGAQLFVSTKSDGETTLQTDSYGKVSAYLPVGALTVSAYAEGCIIRNLKFEILHGENEYPRIGLSDMSLYDVEITSKVMTQEEIIDAGIDITHPDNQHVVKYEMKIQYEPEIDWESIFFYFNSAGQYIPVPTPDPDPDEPEEKPPVIHYHVVGTEPEHKYCRVYEEEMGDLVKLNYEPSRPDLFYRFDGWYSEPELVNKITHKEITEKVNYVYGKWEYFGPEREVDPTPPVKEEDTIIYPVSENFYLIVRGEVQWQKEMFDVEMLIVNNSLTDDMEHVNATLNLPDGLSLATMTGEQQSASQFVGMIPAGETRSVHWYVRGDKAGSYALEARLQGVMMPFNEEIDQVFVSEKDLQVWAGNALHLHFEFPDAAYYAEDYPMMITLTNVSDITLYNVSHAVQLVQGMEVYYSDGSEKRKVEPSFWNSIGVDELHPGDSIVIETTTNIFFESEIMEREIQRYISLVDGAEVLYKGAKVVTTIVDILTFSVDCVETCESALDVLVAAFDDFDEKLEWLGFLVGQVGDLNDMMQRYSDAAIDAAFQPLAEEILVELEAIGNDPFGWYSSHTLDEIIELVSKIQILNKQIKSSAVSSKFDLFDSIRTAISAIPIKFAFSSLTMNQESETTTIPYSYNAYDAGPKYFGVSSVSKYMEALTIAVAGTLYEDIVPWYARLIPGIDDPMGMEEAVDYIKATEKEIAKIQAKDSTGEITFKAWVERNPSTYNMRGAVSLSAEDFILSCDNENAVYEDGVLTFTGSGNIMVEPQNMNGGTLYIEDSEGNLYTYVIDVVEQHECTAGEAEVIISPTAAADGFAVRKCKVCEDILDIILMSAAECEHIFTEWETLEEATCSAVGLVSRSCELCGMLEQEFTEMLPHTEGEWTVTVAPTCTSVGTETTECTVCTKALEREVEMTPHTEGEWVVALEPTAFKTGINELHCADCYAVMMTVEIPMTEETFGLELDNESRIVTGFTVYTTSKMLIDHYENMGMTVEIKDENGNTPRYVGTGCIITYEGVEFTVAVKGDLNGDGQLNAKDMIALKRIMLEDSNIDEAVFVSADVKEDNRLNARDVLALKKMLQ